MRLLCWLGIHKWGRQENIRQADPGIGILFLPVALACLSGLVKDCDRTCVRCNKTKTFTYDWKLG